MYEFRFQATHWTGCVDSSLGLYQVIGILPAVQQRGPRFFGMGMHVEPQDVIEFELLRELLDRK
jgi:hypothetical protein